MQEILQRSVDAVRAQDGVPHINHPNFTWALTAEQLRASRTTSCSRSTTATRWSTTSAAAAFTAPRRRGTPSSRAGVLLYGIAVDDAHHFKDLGNPKLAGPGRGWVVVRARELTSRAILEAMERGDFYASTGVELTDYEVTASAMTVTVKKETFAKYRIQFIGKRRHGAAVKRWTAPRHTGSAGTRATSAPASSTATAASHGRSPSDGRRGQSGDGECNGGASRDRNPIPGLESQEFSARIEQGERSGRRGSGADVA